VKIPQLNLQPHTFILKKLTKVPKQKKGVHFKKLKLKNCKKKGVGQKKGVKICGRVCFSEAVVGMPVPVPVWKE
jgi:hypothetical protein